MTMNSSQTGQSTPVKSNARIEQCNLIIANMRKVLVKASANRAEHRRINKPLVTHGLANQKTRNAGGAMQVWQDMNSRHQDTTYHALAYSMPMQSRLQAGA